MAENLDNVVEEGNKIDYVELKDLRKEQRKKQLRERYESIKEGVGKAWNKTKEVSSKAYSATKSGIVKAKQGYDTVREKKRKFEAWRSKTFKPSAKYSSVARSSTRKALRYQRPSRIMQPVNDFGFSGGIGLNTGGSSDDIFGSFRPTKNKTSSNDFGMGDMFNSRPSSKSKKKKGMFDML